MLQGPHIVTSFQISNCNIMESGTVFRLPSLSKFFATDNKTKIFCLVNRCSWRI